MPRTLGRALAVLLAVLIVVVFLAPWQQNVAASGRVVAFDPNDRIQIVAAPVGGRIKSSAVVEGSRVEAGDVLVEIVDVDPAILERLDAQRVALLAQIEAARAKSGVYGNQVEALERARELAVTAADRELDMAQASVRSASQALAAAQAAESQSKLNFIRHRELDEEGLASDLEFEIAERDYLEKRAMVEQAREALAAARNDVAAREARRGRIDTEARADVERARADLHSATVEMSALEERSANLDTRIARQNSQLVKAPRSGTILRVYAAPGAELVKAGDALISLMPETEDRSVELWVDGNDVPLVRPGRSVRLQFEGWPGVQFAGWPSVAVGTFGGRVALVDPSADAKGRFRILVVPDENDAPWPDADILRQGARANGFVLLDRVTLGYELWRRANDFPPTVAPEEPEDPAQASRPRIDGTGA